ncbi:hypothetical protein [Roseomonas genomospecies 6]|nr:hypothetical protein [Roseomonas genomospecies 6]
MPEGSISYPWHPMDDHPHDHAACACGEFWNLGRQLECPVCGAPSTTRLRAWEVPVHGTEDLLICGCLAVQSAMAAAARAGQPIAAVLSLQSPGAVDGGGGAPRVGTVPQLVIECEDTADAAHPRAPRQHHVEAALGFARQHGGRLLIHCHLGIARSTAMALAVVADGLGPGREAEALDRVLAARPCATPNPLIVALSDRLLDRGGALTAVVEGHPDIVRRRGGQSFP